MQQTMNQAELEDLLKALPPRTTLFVPNDVADALAGNQEALTVMNEMAANSNCELGIDKSFASLPEPAEEGFTFRKRPA